jgi:hypothetical protein
MTNDTNVSSYIPFTLFYSSFLDLWFYPTLWNGVASAVLYSCFGLFAAFVWRRRWFALLLPLVAASMGFVNGFMSGALTSLPIAAIYTSSASKMPHEFAIMLGVFFAVFFSIVVLLRFAMAS